MAGLAPTKEPWLFHSLALFLFGLALLLLVGLAPVIREAKGMMSGKIGGKGRIRIGRPRARTREQVGASARCLNTGSIPGGCVGSDCLSG